MKVLFVSSMYVRPGGGSAGLSVHRQALELHRRGLEVQVICPMARLRRGRGPWEGVLGGTVDVEGVPVTYLPFLNLPLSMAPGGNASLLGWALRRTVSELRPGFPFELIHAHRLFPMGHSAVRLARQSGVPVVVSALGSDTHTHPHRNRGIRRRTEEVLREADAIAPVSLALARQAAALLGERGRANGGALPRRTRVVRMGVDAERFAPPESQSALRARLGLPLHGVGVCYVGRLVREKGTHDLVAAFSSLSDIHPDSWLSIVGDGPARAQLLDDMAGRGLRDRLFLADALPHDQVADWMGAADIFALASHNEGLPNVVLEAMACGLPVLATDTGGMGEAVETGVTGILVPLGSPELLRGGLDALMSAQVLRSCMGKAGRERVLAEFSWARTGQELHELYAEVLTKGGDVCQM